jgi:hypothetical protein
VTKEYGRLNRSEVIDASLSRCFERESLLLISSLFSISLIESIVALYISITFPIPGVYDYSSAYILVYPTVVIAEIIGFIQTSGGGYTVLLSYELLAIVVVFWACVYSLKLAVVVLSLRAFAESDPADLSKKLTRGLPVIVAKVLIGLILYFLIIIIGLAFAIIPGIYFGIALIFWMIFAGVEQDSLIDSFKKSWDFTKNRRLNISILLVYVAGLYIMADVVSGIPSGIAIEWLGTIQTNIEVPIIILLFSVSEFIEAFMVIFSLIVFVTSYQRIKILDNSESEERK